MRQLRVNYWKGWKPNDGFWMGKRIPLVFEYIALRDRNYENFPAHVEFPWFKKQMNDTWANIDDFVFNGEIAGVSWNFARKHRSKSRIKRVKMNRCYFSYSFVYINIKSTKEGRKEENLWTIREKEEYLKYLITTLLLFCADKFFFWLKKISSDNSPETER